jgi:hypothetical protein
MLSEVETPLEYKIGKLAKIGSKRFLHYASFRSK